MLVDTHTHIEGEAFAADFEEVIFRAREAGVSCIVNPGYDLNSSKAAVNLAGNYDFIYAAIGFHPSDVEKFSSEALQELYDLSKHKKVVAIGEIGLDYHYEGYDKNLQKEVFIKQIDLARSLKLPIVIHSRDADKDTFDILEETGAFNLGVLMHCFSGSPEMAREYVKRGAVIGVGGVITFKNARKLVEVVRNLELKHIVLETDAPYLAPEPYRSKRNEPSYIKHVAEKIAEIKSLSYDEVARVTGENALKFYRITE